MTKNTPRRIRSTLLAVLSFTALVTASLLTAPAATAASAPSVDGVTYQAGHVRPVTTSEFQSGVGTLAFSDCPDRRACLFTGADFTVAKLVLDVTDVTPGEWNAFAPVGGPVITWRSAKNTFDDRRLQIGRQLADGSIEVVRCLGPNSALPGPFPDGSKWVRIGVLGSRC
jgi:hypothetical protein